MLISQLFCCRLAMQKHPLPYNHATEQHIPQTAGQHIPHPRQLPIKKYLTF